MKHRLSKAFYEKRAILDAICAYKNLASITLTEDNNYYYYKIETSTYDSILVANEFENYILGLMNT